MARYNAHQNNGVRAVVEAMSNADLTADHGAFFGSIFATLNHILFADQLWLSRFGQGAAPSMIGKAGTEQTATIADWAVARGHTDARIRNWTKTLTENDVVGDLTWVSLDGDKEMSDLKALCLVHFFNHQTHHRGQVHAMLTAAGKSLPDTDLTYLPDQD